MPIGAAIGGAVISGGSSIAGGILGSNAAKAAGQEAQAAAAKANQGLQGVQAQTQSNLQPFVGYGQGASGELAGLLGFGGNPQASQNAFNTFRNSTNYDFLLNQGLQGVQYANAPNFDSGATAKALNNYAQGQAGNALSGYESQLNTLGGQGIQAGSSLGALSNQNLSQQGANLLAAAGVQGQAGIAGANALTGAGLGIGGALSGLAGNLNGAGFNNALSGLFGGQAAGSSSFASGSLGAAQQTGGFGPESVWTAPPG